ncbi:MAG: hypothetical protein QNK83_14375 [Akkermansiaceae bacterium]|jgi:NRPS condensation-like uncharacterized protein|tara:strand:- start:21 stop:980 length:960 start_codon:yes stop_codon:yes gene_type:complete
MSTPETSMNLTARWFQAVEATGDFMGIRYGRKPASSEEVEWAFVSHCDCDGIGGFARLLRNSGAKLHVLPETKHPNREIIKPLWKLWRKSRSVGKVATRQDWDLSKRQEAGSSQVVAWHLFTEEETEQIRQNCRRMNVTVNSFLLKYLDQAVRPDLKKSTAAIPWMIPVNLRGDIKHDDDTENHVSCVEPLVAAEDSPEDIQRQIRHCLASGEHRANYLILGMGRFLSPRAKINLISKNRDKPEGNIGAFSNLGVWDREKVIDTSDSWFFCPPVCKGQLLGAGCVTFQNRLSLTIQANLNFPDQPDIAKTWMARWIGAL